jgi:hypothetical protein
VADETARSMAGPRSRAPPLRHHRNLEVAALRCLASDLVLCCPLSTGMISVRRYQAAISCLDTQS